MTKLVPSRWLDIGQVPFFFCDLIDRKYQAILTLRLVSNAYTPKIREKHKQ